MRNNRVSGRPNALRSLLLGLVALGGLTRCECGSPVSAPGSTLPDECQKTNPVVAAQRTDILFVIDNSDSMGEEQTGVAAELPAFIERLQQGSGVEQDFQIGVVTTSVYLKAHLPAFDAYQEYPTQSGLLRPVPSTGERVLHSTDANLVTKFSELVKQGTVGSGQETPFEAVRLALSPELLAQSIAQGGNGGFLRPDARLLVVLVSDEDDCSEVPPRPPTVWISNNSAVDDCYVQTASLTPVSTYANTFRNLDDGHGQPREVMWATIGPVARSDKHAELILDNGVVRNADCPTSAAPGFRLREMAQIFDTALNNLDSICNPSYRDTLLRIAEVATLGQSVEVMNTSEGGFLQVTMTRQDGHHDLCTVSNGGIRFFPSVGEAPARIYFQNQCLRLSTDQEISVSLLCAG